MGHGSDKLYLTHGEHSGAMGQHTASSVGAKRKDIVLSKLPYDCCALTLKPFETPVCTPEGTIYELLAIIPFLRQHGTDPMTGKKLTPGELIKLTFFRNNEGQYHDPVTFKVFNEHTAIAAVRPSGNVYAKESIDRLNAKPGNWHDLMTDEPFTRKDIIMLQDPLNIQGKDLSKFDYVRRNLEVQTDEGSLSGINVEASGIGRVLKSISDKEKKDKDAKSPSIPKPTSTSASTSASSHPVPSLVKPAASAPVPYNTATVSTNRAAASFTSTAQGIHTKSENALWDEEDLMYEQVRERGEKGYARLVTNYGALNVELFADRAPRTCYNFLRLAHEGKYQNIKFHRLIPGFMLQGGDPTGTGRGGESIWGKPFEDEYNVRNAHKHDQRGTLSMANSGPNTNGSQFFLTFRDQCPHLDSKHTVFGRLVGGHDVLSKLERVPIDPATDRPLKPVVLEDVQVFGDPFEEYKQRLEKRLKREAEEREGQGEKQRRKEERAKDRTTWFGTNLAKPAEPSLLEAQASSSSGIGKYLSAPSAGAPSAAAIKRKDPPTADLFAELGGGGGGGPRGGGGSIGAAGSSNKKKKKTGGGFGDFAGW